jgi:thiamine biosynthesis lipoprotein
MSHRFPFQAMASPCALHLYGDDHARVETAANAAIAEVARIEAKYSRYQSDSVACAINASAGSGPFEVDDETCALLDYAATAWEHSGGLFDITSGVLREVWDFRSGRLPSRKAVDSVLARVGWHRVTWRSRALSLPAGMQIDFGGYGKEYAADRAAEICHEHGISAGLVDLGGDVRIVGPHPDGSSWEIGIRDPRQASGAAASISLDEGGIATSGDYQRFMVVDGRRYGHILDPRSGWPAEGFASVSVVASRCLVAGTASTIAILKGEQGAAWLGDVDLPNLCIGVDGKVSGSLGGSLSGTLAEHSYGLADGSVPAGSDEAAGATTSSREPSNRICGVFATSVAPGNTTT